jgi:hypothetical protein
MKQSELRAIMRKWGRKGARARAKQMREQHTPEERSVIMRAVANVRWAKVREEKALKAAS